MGKLNLLHTQLWHCSVV